MSKTDLFLFNPVRGTYRFIAGGKPTNDPGLFLDGSCKPHPYPEGFSALKPHNIGVDNNI